MLGHILWMGGTEQKAIGQCRGSFKQIKRPVPQPLLVNIDVTLSIYKCNKYQRLFIHYRVDHWDNEKERVVILTDNCMLIVKYDFVAGKLLDCKRIGHATIDTIQKGVFAYPEKTLVT